jgi:hypothetical protein
MRNSSIKTTTEHLAKAENSKDSNSKKKVHT